MTRLSKSNLEISDKYIVRALNLAAEVAEKRAARETNRKVETLLKMRKVIKDAIYGRADLLRNP